MDMSGYILEKADTRNAPGVCRVFRCQEIERMEKRRTEMEKPERKKEEVIRNSEIGVKRLHVVIPLPLFQRLKEEGLLSGIDSTVTRLLYRELENLEDRK